MKKQCFSLQIFQHIAVALNGDVPFEEANMRDIEIE